MNEMKLSEMKDYAICMGYDQCFQESDNANVFRRVGDKVQRMNNDDEWVDCPYSNPADIVVLAVVTIHPMGSK